MDTRSGGTGLDPEDQYHSSKTTKEYTTKKCPHCYTYLKLDASRCTACRTKVGDVDKLGFAAKPTDWRAYLIAAVSIAVFVFFVWWGFFRE
jgi:hypothetical protein